MAGNIKDTGKGGAAMPSTGGKRGRPSNAAKAAAAAQEAAAKVGGQFAPPAPPSASAPAPDKAPAPKAKASENAPGFGHNAPDEGVFLRHVHAIQQHVEGPLAAAQAALKAEKGKLKDFRQAAKADGLVLKELDEAVEDARTERVDLVAKETRRRLYREWLGLPMEQADLFEEDEKTPSLARDQLRWKAQGNTDGRLARPRVAPDGCPPAMDSHYLAGWDEGQAALQRASPMLRDAFNADGTLKSQTPAADAVTASDVLGVVEGLVEDVKNTVVQAIVILGPDDFPEGTALVDANLKTMRPDDGRLEKFDAATRVVAVFEGKRRILKEPGYVDDGEGELSEEEPAAEVEVAAAAGDDSALAAIAEAEPEIVESVVAGTSRQTEEGETPIEDDDKSKAANGSEFA